MSHYYRKPKTEKFSQHMGLPSNPRWGMEPHGTPGHKNKTPYNKVAPNLNVYEPKYLWRDHDET